MRVLVICTGNTCRSQMAEGFLKNMFPHWEIYSAGTEPGEQVNPLAVKAMQEIGIDISKQYPKLVDQYTNLEFDYVLTVCDDANEKCPVFTGKVKHRIHRGFEDPATARGSLDEQMQVYRRVRDEINEWLTTLFNKYK